MPKTELETKTKEIKKALCVLAKRISSGDDSDLLVWVIERNLAIAHRPLRYHPIFGGREDLPKSATEEVLRWVKRIRGFDIKSIICLLHPKELLHYRTLNLCAPNLIEFYKQQGLKVCHIPFEDPTHSKRAKATYHENLARVRAQALCAFNTLPKPTLLHCSAGKDRSAPVAAYIFVQPKTIE